MPISKDPNYVFRDWTVSGVPNVGNPHQPNKLEIRQLLSEHQQSIIALEAGAQGLQVPNLLIRWTVTNDDANAVIASPQVTPPNAGLALNSIAFQKDCTGGMTLNGKPILTNSAEQIQAGYIKAGMIVLFFDHGDNWRILSDIASLSIQQAAEKSSESAKDSANDASQSATAASSSASTASSAASSASQSATAAKTSETNAKTSETNAKASETNAKQSSTSAKTSETNAKTSETAASSSASTASSAASSASQSATAAKTSETNAKTSETNAKASETNAEKIVKDAEKNFTGFDAGTFMKTSTYDPDGVTDDEETKDVFSADNHKDGTTKVVMLATERKAIKQNTDDIKTLKNADKSADQSVWNTGTSETEAVISPLKLTNKINDMFSGGGASGWTKLPNGLIIQFGGAPANASGSTTITFPVKFPTKLISFTASAVVDNDTAVSIGYTNATTYSVLAKPRFSSNSIATEGFTYIAIGY